MKVFSGFPAGQVTVTPLPDFFFSELLPAIDDLGELKVTLHIFWLLAHSKVGYVRASDLAADRVLTESLKGLVGDPAEALKQALTLAVKRGTLLLYTKEDGDDFYLLNSEHGRRAFEKMQDADLPRSAIAHEPVVTQDHPNIYALYEQNIGLLTPMLAEELKQAEEQYPADWIAEAFKIAVENNKRSWNYARKILERWQTEGRGNQARKKSWSGEYDKFVKR